MTITVEEIFDGRRSSSGAKPSQKYDCLIIRDLAATDDPSDADLRAAILSFFPAFIDDPSSAAQLVPSTAEIVQRLSPSVWLGRLTYGSEDAPELKKNGEMIFSFEVTGTKQKIFQSIATKAKRGAVIGAVTYTAPDFKGLIGVTGDGAEMKVEGVDIDVPVYQFAETWYFASITEAYKGAIFRLVGTTNQGSFRGCNIGEVLFVGASGSKRGNGLWEITFKFAASPNTELPAMGGIPPGMDKGGWEYLWFRYTKTTIGTGASAGIALVPIAAYSEQVYQSGDFSALGIGS